MSIVSNTESESHAARFMAWLPQADEPVTAVVRIRAPIRISERIVDAMKGFAETEDTPVDEISTPVVANRRKLSTMVPKLQTIVPKLPTMVPKLQTMVPKLQTMVPSVKKDDLSGVTFMDKFVIDLVVSHANEMRKCLNALAWKLDHLVATPRATQRRLGFVGTPRNTRRRHLRIANRA
jgi:hypothetical protein